MAQRQRGGGAFAKTTRPVIGGAVRREALFARLDGTPARALAWIAGPAGSGKTTLVAGYLEARRLSSIWYQVDPDDADVATFFHYLTHAARRFEERGARELPAFGPHHAVDVASFARRYFRVLFARAGGPAAIVLDNLHEVPAGAPLHDAIEAGIAQVPAGSCVIVASRSEPPATLARLRVSGAMALVGWEELRLTVQEIAAIARLRGQPVSEDAVQKLAERTQGWAAGLVLMLEHARVSGGLAEFPGDAPAAVIFDYLAGEIFERFEPRTQQFLLRIACLPRMSAAVAASLSGEEAAERLLLNLARNDWFVREVPGEDERVFQLHPLLRDFLRARAAQALPEASGEAAIRQAGALLGAAGRVEDAVALHVEHRNWAEVARIAAEESATMLAQGRTQTLAEWLELVPARLLETDARLLRARADCSLPARPRIARRLYAQAYERSRDSADGAGMIASCRGVIDAIVLEFEDLTALDEWLERLAGLLGDDALTAGGAPGAAATLARALLLRDPGHALVPRLLGAAERAARAGCAAPEDLAKAGLARAAFALLRGDVPAGAAAIAPLLAQGDEPFVGARPAIGIAAALTHMLEGAHAQALARAREALDRAAADGMHAWDTWLRVLVAAAALGAGDRTEARAQLAALDAVGAGARRGDRAFVHTLRSWLAVLEGDPARAGQEARMAVAVAVELGIPWYEAIARIALSQTLSADGDRRGAEAQLRNAGALAARAATPLLDAAVEFAAAGAVARAGDAHAVRAPLETALRLAREHGMRHVVAVRAALLAELCATALREDIEPDTALALIRAGSLAPPESAAHLKAWPRPFHVTLLGGFRLMRDGQPVEFTGKGPGRPMELLKVLIALGGRNVRADQLADALWPRVDADYAHKSFTATLHRLRRLLDEEDAVTLRDGRVNLSPRHFWVDTWALEQLAAEIDTRLREARPATADPALNALTDRMLALYRGPFLPDESEQPAFMACRERLRARLLRCLGRVARRWDEAGDAASAVDGYLRLIDADDTCEAFHRDLMLAHQRAGEPVEAMSAYERLRAVLAARLKVMPSAETQAVYAGLLARQSKS
ncbi:MAG: hypothetical protein IT529_00120 [Burkholderiales bacterium]|nr:hypothetical protein [Burkholderiales bacterium]